ncbi:MAG: hypothetical protein KAS63_09285 [Candidatus Heimdallarchaeota archaeon]|nr:hypothetical protein [Candidatus Heimdallarchaeota archaeon]MCK4955542.1 hypothetical protein [Candidatus Heimdallarchaeota archaeon]
MTIDSDDRMCKLTCRSFFCSKKMLRIVKKGNEKTLLCAVDNSECLSYMCVDAECRERKLGDTGTCLRPRKAPQQHQRQRRPQQAQYSKYEYVTPKDLDDKVRKKLTRKYK